MSKIRRILKNSLSLLSVAIHYNRRSKVLYLHDVHDDKQYAVEDKSMPIKTFLDVMQSVKESGFSIVPVIEKKENQVMICFDDGYRGIWDCREYLADNGIFPTIFVATSLIGKDNYLTREEIEILADMGFSIQSHTVSHLPLTSLDKSKLKSEMLESKQTLEQIVHKDVRQVCLPWGYYNEEVLEVAANYYDLVFLSTPGTYWDEKDTGLIHRVLCQESSPATIKLDLLGGQEIFYRRNKKQHYHKTV